MAAGAAARAKPCVTDGELFGELRVVLAGDAAAAREVVLWQCRIPDCLAVGASPVASRHARAHGFNGTEPLPAQLFAQRAIPTPRCMPLASLATPERGLLCERCGACRRGTVATKIRRLCEKKTRAVACGGTTRSCSVQSFSSGLLQRRRWFPVARPELADVQSAAFARIPAPCRTAPAELHPLAAEIGAQLQAADAMRRAGEEAMASAAAVALDRLVHNRVADAEKVRATDEHTRHLTDGRTAHLAAEYSRALFTALAVDLPKVAHQWRNPTDWMACCSTLEGATLVDGQTTSVPSQPRQRAFINEIVDALVMARCEAAVYPQLAAPALVRSFVAVERGMLGDDAAAPATLSDALSTVAAVRLVLLLFAEPADGAREQLNDAEAQHHIRWSAALEAALLAQHLAAVRDDDNGDAAARLDNARGVLAQSRYDVQDAQPRAVTPGRTSLLQRRVDASLLTSGKALTFDARMPPLQSSVRVAMATAADAAAVAAAAGADGAAAAAAAGAGAGALGGDDVGGGVPLVRFSSLLSVLTVVTGLVHGLKHLVCSALALLRPLNAHRNSDALLGGLLHATALHEEPAHAGRDAPGKALLLWLLSDKTAAFATLVFNLSALRRVERGSAGSTRAVTPTSEPSVLSIDNSFVSMAAPALAETACWAVVNTMLGRRHVTFVCVSGCSLCTLLRADTGSIAASPIFPSGPLSFAISAIGSCWRLVRVPGSNDFVCANADGQALGATRGVAAAAAAAAADTGDFAVAAVDRAVQHYRQTTQTEVDGATFDKWLLSDVLPSITRLTRALALLVMLHDGSGTRTTDLVGARLAADGLGLDHVPDVATEPGTAIRAMDDWQAGSLSAEEADPGDLVLRLHILKNEGVAAHVLTGALAKAMQRYVRDVRPLAVAALAQCSSVAADQQLAAGDGADDADALHRPPPGSGGGGHVAGDDESRQALRTALGRRGVRPPRDTPVAGLRVALALAVQQSTAPGDCLFAGLTCDSFSDGARNVLTMANADALELLPPAQAALKGGDCVFTASQLRHVTVSMARQYLGPLLLQVCPTVRHALLQTVAPTIADMIWSPLSGHRTHTRAATYGAHDEEPLARARAATEATRLLAHHVQQGGGVGDPADTVLARWIPGAAPAAQAAAAAAGAAGMPAAGGVVDAEQAAADLLRAALRGGGASGGGYGGGGGARAAAGARAGGGAGDAASQAVARLTATFNGHLRPGQAEALTAMTTATRPRVQAVVLPTGAGKTALVAELAETLARGGTPGGVLMVVPLVALAADLLTADAWGLVHTVAFSDRGSAAVLDWTRAGAPLVVIATVEQVAAVGSFVGAGATGHIPAALVLDEAHELLHSAAFRDCILRCVATLRNDLSTLGRVVLLSATCTDAELALLGALLGTEFKDMHVVRRSAMRRSLRWHVCSGVGWLVVFVCLCLRFPFDTFSFLVLLESLLHTHTHAHPHTHPPTHKHTHTHITSRRISTGTGRRLARSGRARRRPGAALAVRPCGECAARAGAPRGV